MKPLILEVTAFGPFAETEKVDFTQFPSDHPFLIGGPTGAGKSSVLEAMTYALFGELPDSSKSRKRLRSDHADPAAECRVTLTFEARGQKWRVSRTPTQMRRGVRSTEAKPKQPTAKLDEWRQGRWEPVETGIRAIDARMQDTVGLTMDQFSKVAVLPQGQFQQVLNAGTTERVGLLRTLFGTAVFERAVDRIDAQRKTLRQTVQRCATRVSTQRGGASERISKLLGELAGEPAPGAHQATVIELTGRTDRHGPEDRATVTDAELRESLGELRSGTCAELAEQLDAATAESERADSRLATARAEAELIAERDSQLAQRKELDGSADERDRRVAAIEDHRSAMPIKGLLDRLAAAGVTAARHRARVDDVVRRLTGPLADDRIGFPDNLPEQISCGAEPSGTDVKRIKRFAEIAERHAREVSAELALLAKDAKAIDPLEERLEEIAKEEDASAAERSVSTKRREELVGEQAELRAERTQKCALAERVDSLGHNLENTRDTLDARRRLTEATAERDADRARVEELGQSITLAEAELATLGERIQEAREVSATESAFTEQVEQVEAQIAAMSKRDELAARLRATTQDLVRAETEADAALAGFVAGTASTLAASLVDGEGCPVCGSEDHPSPASSDGAGTPAVGADELKAASASVDAARLAHDSARAAVAALFEEYPGLRTADEATLVKDLAVARKALRRATDATGVVASCESSRAGLTEVLERTRVEKRDLELEASKKQGAIDQTTALLGDAIRTPEEELESAHRLADTEHATAVAAADRVAVIDASLDRVENGLSEVDLLLTALDRRDESLSSEKRAVSKSLDDLRAKVTNRVGESDPAEVAAAAAAAAELASELRNALGDLAGSSGILEELEAETAAAIADTDFPNASAVRAAVLEERELRAHVDWIDAWKRSDAIVAEALGRLSAQPLPEEVGDLEELDLAATDCAATAKRLNELWTRTTAELEGIEELLDAALQEESASAPSAQRLALLDDVHGVLTGSRTGNYLAVEAWVLSSYLAEVVMAANVHLRSLTDGRFSLEIDSSDVAGNAKRGLDLVVVDADTGRSRPTQTLSGGETFQASLALALGFADVLTAGAAGLQIDALFIDEGFGTLDADSVDTVIEVLDSLRGRGAMVGLISHVEAMKEALPVALEVRKRSDHKGSRLRQELSA